MINFAVGPVMMDPAVLRLGSDQIPYFRTDEFSRVMSENETLLKRFANATESSRVIFLTGSGTAAMEASVMNFFTNDDKVLVVNGGTFGKRFKDICEVHKVKVEEIQLKYGEPLTLADLIPYEGKGFTGFLINMHETSTGVLYDMNLVKDFCKRNGLFLVVDAIGSFLADEYDMCGINATILSSQKGLALPPGISFVIVDETAQEKIYKSQVCSLYFDFKEYLMDGKRGQTPYTPAVGILLQLRKRLELIASVGVERIIDSVAALAQDFRNKIRGLPMQIASPTPSNALTPLRPTGKMAADDIVKYLKDNYDIFVCPNGGDLSKTLFRVGHIGALTKAENNILVNALREMNDRKIL